MTNKNVVTGTGDNFGFEEVTSNAFAQHLAKYEQMNDILNIRTGSRVQGTVISKNGKYFSFFDNEFTLLMMLLALSIFPLL